MSINLQAAKVLWARAHNQCAFPGCPQALTQDEVDATTGDALVTVIGHQAHIRSYKRDGPRYDPKYPVSKLHTYENLILLCPTHHLKVDAHGGAGYSVSDLIKMRVSHEQQQQRRERIETVLRAYTAQQYRVDDKVLFEQVDLNGPSVDAMFVDVPFACRPDAAVADLMQQIATDNPGDLEATDGADGQIVTGAAQALLHPRWSSNALLVGGPGQGKSTLLQYVCQFHRARLLDREAYTGEAQQLNSSPMSSVCQFALTCERTPSGQAAGSTTPRRRRTSGSARKQPKESRIGPASRSTSPSRSNAVAAGASFRSTT